MMQLVLRYQDHREHKKENPDGETVVSWVLNTLHNDVARAANISQSKHLLDAQNLVSQVIKTTGSQLNFQDILEILREMITKITTEAAKLAKELKF